MDLTISNVNKQIDAMRCQSFEIGIYDGRMFSKNYTPGKLIKSIQYFKAMNYKGNNVYIRPSEDLHDGLILLDDLTIEKIETLKTIGLTPAAVVETSPENFQSWIRIAPVGVVISDEIRSLVAKRLTAWIGCDPASAEKRHYGRLAGFTNRKLKHRQPNGFPFCIFRGGSGVVAPAGERLIREAEKEEKNEFTVERRLRKDQEVAYFLFKKYWLEWKNHQNEEELDFSKGDYAVSARLFKEGFMEETISEAIFIHSPDLLARKGGQTQAAAYAARTASAVARRLEERPLAQEKRIKGPGEP